MRLYSYVVRYDSGFAPNPFYDFCTLATCKPSIRKHAKAGDWVLGCGSDNRNVRLGGRVVYAMRITEALSFDEYAIDIRFSKKIPYRRGSRKQSCGDNIYHRSDPSEPWQQRDSFHSREDGTLNQRHLRRDTSVNRVLISDDYIYFGGSGPALPRELKDKRGRPLAKSGIGLSCFDDPEVVGRLVTWIRQLGVAGYQGPPFEWMQLRERP